MMSGYRAVAKRRGAYAAMPSPEAYRAVAKRKGAYAAMPVWGYRGVSGFYDPAIPTFPFLRSPGRALSLASFFFVFSVLSVRTLCFDLWNERKGYRAVAKRKGAYAAMPSPEAYRAVAKRRNAYAAMFVLSVFSVPSVRTSFLIFGTNERGIAPSREEEALTPRCPRTKVYRAVAKRRSAYAAMPVWGYRGVTKGTPRSLLFPSKERIAPSQQERALTLRCLSSLRSLWPLCEPFLKHANLKVGVPRRPHRENENRGIAPSRKEEALTPRCPRTKAYRAATKRKGAYAAMPVLALLSV